MSKLSVCLIVGNVEEYIGRCLESFASLADEFSIVRAIGGQTPDKTIDIAKEVAERNGKPLILGEYRNKPENADWPHIDDFAAARNQSFDQATGDYLFWCDSDDILEEGAAGIARELADRGGFPCFIFPYRIFGQGVTVPRERMIARGAGRWTSPVHECIEFMVEPVKAVQDERVVVIHLPHFTGPKAKTGSVSRNMRILKSIPADKMDVGLLYHLHGEYICADDIPNAIETAKKALACKELGRPERYEIFMRLANFAELPQEKEAFLHQAYKADPRRREALGLLTCNALDYQQNELAMAYAKSMMALPMPRDIAWNSRADAYGWLGYDFYAQALRANGQFFEADEIRRKALAEVGGARITLVHATRGRPQKAAFARKMWFDMAEHPERVEHVFCIDQDDDESFPLTRMHHIVVPSDLGCVGAWNFGTFSSNSDVVVQMSDDWTPPPMWDKIILERIGDVTKPAVLAVSDGVREDKLLCMAICTRAYWQQDNFLFHPWFTGVFSDNWFTDQAYLRGQVIEARDVVFEHAHPAFGKGKLDATYLRQNSKERYDQGAAVYAELQKRTDWSTCHGWFDYWQFYNQIAKYLNDGDSIAEIGVWQGRSIIYMAQTLKRMGKRCKIYAVDTFKGEEGQQTHADLIAASGGNLRDVFEANLKRCGVEDCVEIIQGDSAEMAAKIPDGSLTFAYIDADHHYQPVLRDVKAWLPKLRPTGILAGHDAQWSEVRRAVLEVIPDSKFMGSVWSSLPKNR